MEDGEFEQLMEDSMQYMEHAIHACNREWDFPGYDNWGLDLERGVLVFSGGKRPPIECDVQVAGMYMSNRNFWRWSWDNPTIEPALRSELEKVRAFGAANDIREITSGGFTVQDEEAAWVLTAIAAKLIGAKSVYRAANDPQFVFVLITRVRRV